MFCCVDSVICVCVKKRGDEPPSIEAENMTIIMRHVRFPLVSTQTVSKSLEGFGKLSFGILEGDSDIIMDLYKWANGQSVAHATLQELLMGLCPSAIYACVHVWMDGMRIYYNSIIRQQSNRASKQKGNRKHFNLGWLTFSQNLI